MAELPAPTPGDYRDLIRWLEREADEVVELADRGGEYQSDWDGYAMAMAGAAVATQMFVDNDNDRRDPESLIVLAGGTQWFRTSPDSDSRLYQSQWDAAGLENLAEHLIAVSLIEQHPLGVRAAARQISGWLRLSAAEARAADSEAQ